MNKHYLKAMLAGTSKDETRQTLQGVLAQRNGDNVRLVSTNGFVLYRAEFDQKVEDAPCGDNGAFATVNDTIIPYASCKAIIDLCKSGKMYSPNTQIYIGDKSARINLEHNITFTPIEGKFPDYERVIPPMEKKVFTIDLTVLESLVQFAKAIRDGKDQKHGRFGIRFFSEAPDRGILIELCCSDAGEGKFDGVIMPIRD